MRFFFLVFASAFALLSFASGAWADEATCKSLFQQKRFEPAAECFLQLLPELEKQPQLVNVAPLLKDRYLRNASVCYRRAAAAEKDDISRRSWLLEQSLENIQETIRKKYCEASNRCSLNATDAENLRKEIGYAPLAIVTGSTRITLTVEGYKYKQTATQDFNQTVRPGKYKITLQEPGSPAKDREVEVKPNLGLSINATQPQIQIVEKQVIVARNLPPLVIAGYAVGSAVALGGIGLLSYGYITQASLNQCESTIDCKPKAPRSEYEAQHATAGSMIVIGWSAFALGAVVLVGAGIAQSVSTPPPAPKNENFKLSQALYPALPFRQIYAPLPSSLPQTRLFSSP